MCFKSPPPAPAVQPMPQRADVQGDVADMRTKLASQTGVQGNIFTSALGDTGYGKNSQNLAKLGSSGGGRGGSEYGGSANAGGLN